MKQSIVKKMILMIIMILIGIIAYTQIPDTLNNFRLVGKLDGKDTGRISLAYLNKMNRLIEDTAIIQNGHFVFTGSILGNEPTYASLCGNIKSNSVDDPDFTEIFLEPRDLDVSLKEGNFKGLKVSGSLMQKEVGDFKAQQQQINKQTVYISKLLAEKTDSLKKNYTNLVLRREFDSISGLLKPYKEALDSIGINYIINNKDSYYSGYLLSLYTPRLTMDSAKILFNNLTARVRNSRLVGLLRKRFLMWENGTFTIGQPAKNFTAVDANGNSITLSSFRNKNLILLDFWASWCIPCRMENPRLVEIYKKFHPKGLEIIGISNDYKTGEWKNAIKKDGINLWYNVLFSKHLLSDIRTDTLDVTSIIGNYYVKYLPTQILISKTGIIIGVYIGDNSINKIEEKLEHIFN